MSWSRQRSTCGQRWPPRRTLCRDRIRWSGCGLSGRRSVAAFALGTGPGTDRPTIACPRFPTTFPGAASHRAPRHSEHEQRRPHTPDIRGQVMHTLYVAAHGTAVALGAYVGEAAAPIGGRHPPTAADG
jgi:hypothetical protein